MKKESKKHSTKSALSGRFSLKGRWVFKKSLVLRSGSLVLCWAATSVVACGNAGSASGDTSDTLNNVPAAGTSGASNSAIAGAGAGGSAGASGGGDAGAAGAAAAMGGANAGGMAGAVAATGGAGAAGDTGGENAGAGGTGGMPHVQTDCPPDALLCDDFEGYALGGDLSPNWETALKGGMVEVETSKPFAGAQGLRISTTLSPADEPPRAPDDGGPVRSACLVKQGAPVFPLPGNSFFGRVMMWLTDMPPGGVHFSNFEANGRLPDNRVAKYGFGGMFEHLLAGYTIRPMNEFDVPPVDLGQDATQGLPEKRWSCIEWHFDGMNNEMHLWFDGEPQQSVTNPEWVAPTFDKIYIGWRHSQPSPIDVEMWLDNVVLSTTRIGCPEAP